MPFTMMMTSPVRSRVTGSLPVIVVILAPSAISNAPPQKIQVFAVSVTRPRVRGS